MKHCATLIAIVLAAPAFGADLTVGLGAAVEYDENVFRRSEDAARDEEDDFLFRLRPSVRIHEDRGQDLNYGIQYELPMEFAVEFSDELNDVDHVVRGNLLYHVNDRIDIFANDSFGALRSVLRQEIEDDRGPDISTERERVRVNNASIGLSYRASPRLIYRVIANSDLFDSSRDDRARVVSVAGTADALYALTHTHQVGGGVRYGYQDFSDRERIAGSRINTYNLFASWRWIITDTLSFDARFGPSYLESDQQDADRVRRATPVILVPLGNGDFLAASFDVQGTPAGSGSNCQRIEGRETLQTCALNVRLDRDDDDAVIDAIRDTRTRVRNVDRSGEDDDNLNVFAEVTLRKDWSPTLQSALRYMREQGNASGLGGTVIRDAVSLSNTWSFAERWQFALRGDWTRRQSIFDIQQTLDVAAAVDESDLGLPPGAFPGGVTTLAGRCNTPGCATGTSFNSTRESEIDTDRWSVAGRITHRLFRSTQVYGQVRYDRQESRSDTLGIASDFENILGTFGVQHTFEPIKLW